MRRKQDAPLPAEIKVTLRVTARPVGRKVVVFVNGGRGRDLSPTEARQLAIGLDESARRALEQAADEIEGK